MAYSSRKVLIILLAISIGVALVLQYQKIIDLFKVNFFNSSNPNKSPVPPASPLPVNLSTKTETNEVSSSDGTMILVMKKEKGKDNIVTYSFFTADNSSKEERILFKKIAGPTDFMALPANSWSPDNKYIFLQENKPGSTTALIFKASGEVFAEDQQYLDVGSLLAQRDIGFSLNEVTGWDSTTLLRVNTMDGDVKGPSYWFDVSAKSFMQLAKR